MPTGRQLVQLAQSQKGKPYVFGAEAKDLNARAWDCSELVEVVCQIAGVTPRVPDGAFYQWKAVSPISVEKAKKIPGALLFCGSGKGTGRAAIDHVAFSRGDGTTIEARGKAWGTGNWAVGNRFQFAGLIKGVDYTSTAPLPLITQPEGEDVTYLRNSKTGAIYSFSGEHFRHIGPEVWKVRQFLGAKAKDVTPEELITFTGRNELIPLPTTK